MSSFIIGTSGHIDHGKTSLIKALTGINTDRLKEEQAKGISIDIGFSYVDFNNQKVGIIDIPGHEKFIKNMLAGASSIDICLFIVACDDGIKPQTIEHFDILNLLNIKHGIIVLNKIDRVSNELIAKRIKQLKAFTKHSFLADAPIVQTSIYDETTINNLKTTIITTLTKLDQQKNNLTLFRMPIDRSFSLNGIGHVITGTTMGMDVKVGDKLEILPQKQLVTIKNIQNHNQNVTSLSSNHRGALNITYNNKFTIKRGDVIATPNILALSSLIDIELTCLKNSKFKIKNGQKVKVYHLANEISARIKLLNTNEVSQNQTAIAQLVLEKPIIAINGDIVIIRNNSPLFTIGGGQIINVCAKQTKRFNKQYINSITNLHQSTTHLKIAQIIKEHSANFYNLKQYHTLLVSYGDYEKYINELDEIIKINNHLVHTDYLNALENNIISYLTTFHKQNPNKLGADISVIRNRFFSVKNKTANTILNTLNIKITNNIVKLHDFEVKLSPKDEQAKQAIIKLYEANHYTLTKISELKTTYPNHQTFDEMTSLMIQNKILINIENEYFLLQSQLTKLIEYLSTLETITLANVKTYTNASRKSNVAILEFLDRKLITKRLDDYRVLIKGEFL